MQVTFILQPPVTSSACNCMYVLTCSFINNGDKLEKNVCNIYTDDSVVVKVKQNSPNYHEMQLTWSGGACAHVISCIVQLAILRYIII